MTYIRQCAWCKKILGTKMVPSDTERPNNITHTICPSCNSKILRQLDHLQEVAFPSGSAAVLPLKEPGLGTR